MPTCLLYFLVDNSAYQNASTADAVQERLNWLFQKLGAQRNVTVKASINAVDIGCKSLKALTDVTKIGSVVLQPASVGVFSLQSALNKISSDIARESAISAGAFRYLYVIAHRSPMPKLQASLLKQKMTSCGFADSRLFLLEGMSADDFLSLARNCVQASNDTLFNEVLEDMGLDEPEVRPEPKMAPSREDKIKQLMKLYDKGPQELKPAVHSDDVGTSGLHGAKTKPQARPTSAKTEDTSGTTVVSTAQNKVLQQQIKDLESLLDTEKSKNQQLIAKLQEQEGNVKELKATLQDAKTLKQKAQDSSKLNGRVKELEASLLAATTKNEQLMKSSQEQDAKVKELEAKLAESSNQNEQLMKSSQEQDAKVKELEAKLAESSGQNEQLTKSTQEQNSKVKELEAKLQESATKNEQLTKASQEQDAKVKELEEKLTEAANQTELQYKSAQDQEAKIKELETKLQMTSAIVVEMRQKEQDETLKKFESEKKMMLLEAEKNSMKAQLDMSNQLQMQTQKDLATLNVQLQKANADKEEMETKLEAAKEEATKAVEAAKEEATKAARAASDKAARETSAIQQKYDTLEEKYNLLVEDTKEYMKKVDAERARQKKLKEKKEAEEAAKQQKQQEKFNSLFGGDDFSSLA